MNPLQLRREIEDEMKRTRLDKTRILDLLLKIVDAGVGAGESVPGPAGPEGPMGPQGPAGPAGPAGECKCQCVREVAPETEEAPKKVVTKKVVTKKSA